MSDAQTAQIFISLRHTAARLGVPAAWLKGEAEAGRIPFLKAGRKILFNIDTLERVLLERAGVGHG